MDLTMRYSDLRFWLEVGSTTFSLVRPDTQSIPTFSLPKLQGHPFPSDVYCLIQFPIAYVVGKATSKSRYPVAFELRFRDQTERNELPSNPFGLLAPDASMKEPDWPFTLIKLPVVLPSSRTVYKSSRQLYPGTGAGQRAGVLIDPSQLSTRQLPLLSGRT
jgi:hypothetical protein